MLLLGLSWRTFAFSCKGHCILIDALRNDMISICLFLCTVYTQTLLFSNCLRSLSGCIYTFAFAHFLTSLIISAYDACSAI